MAFGSRGDEEQVLSRKCRIVSTNMLVALGRKYDDDVSEVQARAGKDKASFLAAKESLGGGGESSAEAEVASSAAWR